MREKVRPKDCGRRVESGSCETVAAAVAAAAGEAGSDGNLRDAGEDGIEMGCCRTWRLDDDVGMVPRSGVGGAVHVDEVLIVVVVVAVGVVGGFGKGVVVDVVVAVGEDDGVDEADDGRIVVDQGLVENVFGKDGFGDVGDDESGRENERMGMRKRR